MMTATEDPRGAWFDRQVERFEAAMLRAGAEPAHLMAKRQHNRLAVWYHLAGSVEIPIEPNQASDPVEVQIASLPLGEPMPSPDDATWWPYATVLGRERLTIRGILPGSTVYIRMRSQPGATSDQFRPSPWRVRSVDRPAFECDFRLTPVAKALATPPNAPQAGRA